MSNDTMPGRPAAVKAGIAAAIVLVGLYLAAIPWRPLSGGALGGRPGGDGALWRCRSVVGHSGTAERADRLGGLPVIPGRAGAFGKWTDEVPVGMDRARHRGFSGPQVFRA